MIAVLSELLALSQTWLTVTFVVFLRIGACFMVLPVFGDQMIPMRVKLAAALGFTMVVVPMVQPALADLRFGDRTAQLLFSETLSGLLLGIAVRLAVHALQIAGSIAAQATSLAQIMGGASPDPQPAIGAILQLAGLTLAIVSGLHLHIIDGFVASYTVLPLGTLPLGLDVGAWGVAQVSAAFAMALSLSAPFLIGSLLYNVALGVINKAMPQLMVAFVGAPAITWGGLMLLLLSVPILLPLWLSYFEATIRVPFVSN